MRQILIGDDGSPAAMQAIATAAELAARTGAELMALAVVDPAQFRTADVTAFARSEALDECTAEDHLLDVAADYLDRCRAVAAEHGVSRVRLERRTGGDAAAAIIEFAREHGVDLIVVGSRGHGRFPGLLLGSVSQKLASHAPCSVLIAR